MQVDFYLLQDESLSNRHKLCVRLCAKAYAQKQPTWVLANSAIDAQTLDEWLWTFSDTSFIPHTIAKSEDDQTAPILISHHLFPNYAIVNLINLQENVPSCHQQAKRLLEIVPRQIAREHYRLYRQNQYTIQTHEIA